MALFREVRPYTVNGYEAQPVCVWDYGGEGPPLLMAHCTGTMGRIWDVVVAELKDAYRVFAIDTRGQGDSPAPATRDHYRWILSGHDLLAIVDHYAMDTPWTAVGHSAGGAHVAYAEFLRPGTFPKAVLIDPIMGEAEWFAGENPLAEKVRRRINSFESLEAARERLTAKPPLSQWVTGAIDTYLGNAFNPVDGGGVTLKCPGDREAWYYELGGACDVYDALGTLQFDTCLVTGENSYVQPMVVAQRKRLPNSRMEVVVGAGHFIPQENPQAVAALIEAHLQPD